MILNFFSYIFSIHYFIIDTITWICISFSKKRYECIKRTFGMKVAMRKVQFLYNIITIWCILIIWLANIDVWINSSTSPLIRLVQNFPAMFFSWRCKRHIDLFFYCKTVSQYNQNRLENWEDQKCYGHWESIDQVKIEWLNKLYL